MNGLRQRLWGAAGYCRSNPKLLIAVSILLALVLFHVIGSLVVDPGRADPLSGAPCQPPSLEYLLGTDFAGRQLMEVMIVGMGLTLRIGVQAALIGLVIGIDPTAEPYCLGGDSRYDTRGYHFGVYGPGSGRPVVDVAHSRHQSPGAQHARESIHPGGQALGHE